MPVEVNLNTPLANALNVAIQPKLVEAGWAGDENDSALAEYIILMLVNGKTQDEIAQELSRDLLNLAPEDPSSHEFAKWLFDQIEILNGQMNGGAPTGEHSMPGAPQGATGEMDMDMGSADASDLNMYVCLGP